MSDYVSVSRTCVRCGADVHMSAQAQPHLCADIAKRLARREKQVQAVMDIIQEHVFGSLYIEQRRDMAESIVAKLANMGVQND